MKIEVPSCNIETKQIEWSVLEKIDFRFIEIMKPVKCNKKKINRQKIIDYNKKDYYKLVWKITLSNDIVKLMNGKKRGFRDYHIDHIYPIILGYKNGIPPEVIGDVSNLKPLYWRDNLKKSFKIKL